MPYLLGLDPSLSKTGYVILDASKPYNTVEEKGLLKTSPRDGLTVQRLIKQANNIKDKISEFDIKFIGMEAPFFSSNSTEILYALNQYLHKVYLDKSVFVVCFPPQMLKKLVYPERSVAEIGKPHMIHKAKTFLDLHGQRLAEDVADAFWAGHFGKRFYKYYIEKVLSEKDLDAYEREKFCGKHVYKRGVKKGLVDLTGIIYRENELFYDFAAIKRRAKDADAREKSKRKKDSKKDSKKK